MGFRKWIRQESVKAVVKGGGGKKTKTLTEENPTYTATVS